MRLIEGNGHKFLELPATEDYSRLYIPVDKITCISVQDDSLVISVDSENFAVNTSPAELFSLLGCNILTTPESVPF